KRKTTLKILLILRQPSLPDRNGSIAIGLSAVGIESFCLTGMNVERRDRDLTDLQLRIAQRIDQLSVELYLLFPGEVDLIVGQRAGGCVAEQCIRIVAHDAREDLDDLRVVADAPEGPLHLQAELLVLRVDVLQQRFARVRR